MDGNIIDTTLKNYGWKYLDLNKRISINIVMFNINDHKSYLLYCCIQVEMTTFKWTLALPLDFPANFQKQWKH